MAIRGGMTRSSIVAAVVVTLLLALLIWWRDEHASVERSTEALSPTSSAASRSTGQVAAVPTARSVSPAMSPAVQPSIAPPAAASAAEVQRPYEPAPMTEAMRERRRRVLDSPEARAPAAPASSASGAAPAGMKDRTGKMGPEVKALNEQLLPLVDQCFDQATERGVRGRGMLALQVKFAGAEGIGRIIESVEPTESNAIGDPELIDCVRQSAFTVDLPPPTASGASEGMLTIPFEGAPDAG
jgi:hypothetical protein